MVHICLRHKAAWYLTDYCIPISNVATWFCQASLPHCASTQSQLAWASGICCCQPNCLELTDWASECPDVKNYKWRLNPVWHRMHYSCTSMATVGFKGLMSRSSSSSSIQTQSWIWYIALIKWSLFSVLFWLADQHYRLISACCKPVLPGIISSWIHFPTYCTVCLYCEVLTCGCFVDAIARPGRRWYKCNWWRKARHSSTAWNSWWTFWYDAFIEVFSLTHLCHSCVFWHTCAF